MAISIKTDAIGWAADAGGERLTIRTPLARRLAAEIVPGKEYTVEIKQFRQKRSLDANALYWAMLNKLAAAVNVSSPYLHNLMLRRYGELERYGDKLVYVVLPDTDETSAKADNAETYHLKPTSKVREGKDGLMYRTYLLLRGSSTYDSKEMSRLQIT